MRVELCGRSRVVVGDDAVSERALGGAVARRVLAVLAVAQRPVTRDELGEAVWGESLPKTWETALRGAIQKLRRSVGGLDSHGDGVIRTAFGSYLLAPEVDVDVVVAAIDVDRAESALSAGDATTAARCGERAATVLAQPFLSGLESEWIDDQRRRLEPLCIRALLATSAAFTALGNHQRAVESALAAVERDVFLESTHRRLMAAHAAAGDRAAALLAYRRCRDVLADELDLDPSELTEQAHRFVLSESGPVTPIAMPAGLLTDRPLAGRAREFTLLQRAWEDVAAGGAATMVVLGAAGIGKSRLVAEMASHVHRAGAAVVHGRFDPDDFAAFGAFEVIFGQLGVAWPPPEMRSDGGNVDRGVMLDAAVAMIRAAATSRRIVMVLDDIHWADRLSSALLSHVSTAGIGGLLILATARDDWVPTSLAELLETVGRVDLEPLDADGVAELIVEWAGHRPDDALVDGVTTLTAGNPFFVTAVLQDLADRGEAQLATGVANAGQAVDELPASISALVAVAVDRCGDVAADVATAGAVLGSEFHAEVVGEVVGHGSGATRVALERLVHARIVGRSTRDAGRFRFVHALVRDAILARAQPSALKSLHARAASVLQDQSGSGSGDLLRHLLATGDDGDLSRASILALDLAQELVERGSAHEAAKLLTGVLDAVDGAVFDDHALRARLLAALSFAEMAVDDITSARSRLKEAAEIALRLRDPSILVSGSSAMRPPPFDQPDASMIHLAECLLELSAPGSRVQATMLCWLALELIASSEPDRAAAAGTEAVSIARSLDDPVLLRQATITWHLTNRVTATPVQRRDVLEVLLALRSPVGKRAGDLTARIFLAGDHLELGDLGAARSVVGAALDASAGFGATHLRWLALRNAVLLAAMEGDLEEAEALGIDSAAVAASFALPEAMMLQLLQLVMTRYHQGRLDEIEPMISALAAVDPPTPLLQIVLGWVAAELDLPSSVAAVDAGVAALRTLPRDAPWVGLVAMMTEATAKVGHSSVGDMASFLEPWSGSHVVIVTIAYLGAVDRYLGLAAAARGDLVQGRDLQEAGHALHVLVGSRPYVARSRRELDALS